MSCSLNTRHHLASCLSLFGMHCSSSTCLCCFSSYFFFLIIIISTQRFFFFFFNLKILLPDWVICSSILDPAYQTIFTLCVCLSHPLLDCESLKSTRIIASLTLRYFGTVGKVKFAECPRRKLFWKSSILAHKCICVQKITPVC